MRADAGDITLTTYEASACKYAGQVRPVTSELAGFLDRLAGLVPGGSVLELGSGPGRDADYLEQRGLTVARTDGTKAFVEMLRANGQQARLLDARYDELGGPYDALLADAMLLHLTRVELAALLVRAHGALAGQAILAFTVKDGDGEAWSEARLSLPRYFTYWRAEPLRDLLERTGWTVLSLTKVAGRLEPWLYVLAQSANPARS
ncbi:MAG: methyltransferase domain-containing protein [Jatrophihabitantaceae bacterium]